MKFKIISKWYPVFRPMGLFYRCIRVIDPSLKGKARRFI